MTSINKHRPMPSQHTTQCSATRVSHGTSTTNQQLGLDWLDDVLDSHNNLDLEMKHCPIAASVAAWRALKLSSLVWADLSQAVPTDEDHVKAIEIRRYYRDRLMIKSLRGQPLTKFQVTLQSILETERYQNQHLGIIYRLPYFYAEDQARDSLMSEMQCLPESVVKTASGPYRAKVQPSHLTVRPRRFVVRTRKGWQRKEYWFADSENHAAMWEIDANNPLISLTDSLFDRSSIRLCARFEPTKHAWQQDWWFYKISDARLA